MSHEEGYIPTSKEKAFEEEWKALKHPKREENTKPICPGRDGHVIWQPENKAFTLRSHTVVVRKTFAKQTVNVSPSGSDFLEVIFRKYFPS